MVNLSLNLLYEIFGFLPRSLVTIWCVNKRLKNRIGKSIEHLYVLLEEVLDHRDVRSLDFLETVEKLVPVDPNMYLLVNGTKSIKIYNIENKET